MPDPRYPIGPFIPQQKLEPEERRVMIEQIATTPSHLRKAVEDLNDDQLDTPYREGGWTVRQVAHHLPDSHVNAYIRLKLALTEHGPTIKPYDEAKWAQLEDSRDTPVRVSLDLLESLHERWVILLRRLDEQDFSRKLTHPEHGEMTIDWLVAMYAWHGRHHVGHITALRERMGW